MEGFGDNAGRTENHRPNPLPPEHRITMPQNVVRNNLRGRECNTGYMTINAELEALLLRRSRVLIVDTSPLLTWCLSSYGRVSVMVPNCRS